MSDSDLSRSIWSVGDLPSGADLGTTLALKMTSLATEGGGYIYFPPGSWAISGVLETPPNITLWFASGATLQIADGSSVTIGGDIIAKCQQIFDVSPGGRVYIFGCIPAVYPEWWGAGNGLGVDARALQAAVDAVSAGRIAADTTVLPTIPVVLSGEYLISATIVIEHSDDGLSGPDWILLRGARGAAGTPTATLRAAADFGAGGPLLIIYGPGGFSIKDVYFDSLNIAAGCVEVVFQVENSQLSNRSQANSFERCVFSNSNGAPLISMTMDSSGATSGALSSVLASCVATQCQSRSPQFLATAPTAAVVGMVPSGNTVLTAIWHGLPPAPSGEPPPSVN